MTDLENSEFAPQIMARLQQRMNKLVIVHGTTQALVNAMQELLSGFRAACRHELGVDFPVMRAIVLPSIQQLYLVRADLDVAAIETTIVNICTEHPAIDMHELAREVARAFPSYRPAQLSG